MGDDPKPAGYWCPRCYRDIDGDILSVLRHANRHGYEPKASDNPPVIPWWRLKISCGTCGYEQAYRALDLNQTPWTFKYGCPVCAAEKHTTSNPGSNKPKDM